jgi:formylglycine-generating enzyme required for sulfatase activity
MYRVLLAALVIVTTSLFVVDCETASGDDAPKPKKPGTPKEKILPLFVEEFVLISPGKDKFPESFVMGSADEAAPASEKPAHKVTFKRPFRIAKHEVTQELYELIAGKNPSKWPGPRNSVEMVSWDEARDFCDKVTTELRKQKLIAADEVVRLPSEAEWEYACRAATTTKFSFGDKVEDLGDYGWFTGNAKGNDPPVGQKKPNPWGLYDMHGYVWEWCADAWHDNYQGAPADGSARDAKDSKRVIRGGAWTEQAELCRSAFRRGVAADSRTAAIGFRCILEKKSAD